MKQDGSRLVFHAALQTERKRPRALLPGSRIARRGGSEELAKEGARQRGRSGQKEDSQQKRRGAIVLAWKLRSGGAGEGRVRGEAAGGDQPATTPVKSAPFRLPAAAAACIPTHGPLPHLRPGLLYLGGFLPAFQGT